MKEDSFQYHCFDIQRAAFFEYRAFLLTHPVATKKGVEKRTTSSLEVSNKKEPGSKKQIKFSPK